MWSTNLFIGAAATCMQNALAYELKAKTVEKSTLLDCQEQTVNNIVCWIIDPFIEENIIILTRRDNLATATATQSASNTFIKSLRTV